MDKQKHIILIGFKHVGKTTIGHLLSKKMNRSFFDTDNAIESLFFTQNQKKLNCREIMQEHGSDFFKALETEALAKTLEHEPAIISLGGGTPMEIKNQQLIASHIVIHLTGDPKTIFNRIMKKGRPAFFPLRGNARKFFEELWEERKKAYEQLTPICVENHNLKEAVEEIYRMLEAASENRN